MIAADSSAVSLPRLKEQLATIEGDEAQELRQEIEELEDRIDELTSFRTGTEVHE